MTNGMHPKNKAENTPVSDKTTAATDTNQDPAKTEQKPPQAERDDKAGS